MKKKVMMGLLVVAMVTALIGCGNSQSDSAGVNGIAAKADENGNYVVNGGFEDADLSDWKVNNVDDITEEIDVYTRETDCHGGAQCLHYYSTKGVNFTAEQTLTGLEAGNYKLTGYIQGDTAGDADASIYFYAIVNGETVKADVTLGGYLNWYEAELSGLNVKDGEITIGINVTNAPDGWGTIDDITLVKDGN